MVVLCWRGASFRYRDRGPCHRTGHWNSALHSYLIQVKIPKLRWIIAFLLCLAPAGIAQGHGGRCGAVLATKGFEEAERHLENALLGAVAALGRARGLDPVHGCEARMGLSIVAAGIR